MAKIGNGNGDGFDAHAPENQSAGFEPLPPGRYDLIVVETDLKPNKKRTGDVLTLVYEVISGEFKKRKIYNRLNYNHPDAETQKISRGELSRLIKAVGLRQIDDSDEVKNIPFVVDIGVRGKAEDEYGIQNVVKKYYDPTETGGKRKKASPAPAEEVEDEEDEVKETPPPKSKSKLKKPAPKAEEPEDDDEEESEDDSESDSEGESEAKEEAPKAKTKRTATWKKNK